MLIAHGADVNLQGDGNIRALDFAQFKQAKDAIKILEEAGATSGKTQEKEESGVITITKKQVTENLLAASRNGDADAVLTALALGADINALCEDGFTPLMSACLCGHPDVAELLLKKGADPLTLDVKGFSVLAWVRSQGLKEMIPMIQAARQAALPDKARNAEGTDQLINAAYEGDLDTVKSLLADGADMDALGKEGATAVMVAGFSQRHEIIHYLAQQGADLEVLSRRKLTALQMACSIGHAGVVEILIAAGANTHVTDMHGAGVITTAATAGRLDCVDVLLKSGLNINTGDEGGMTALMYCCAMGQYEGAKHLIKRGADTTIKLPNGVTALDIAEHYRHQNIVELLSHKN